MTTFIIYFSCDLPEVNKLDNNWIKMKVLSLAQPYHENLQIGLITRTDTLRPRPYSHIVIELLNFGQSEPESLNMREQVNRC